MKALVCKDTLNNQLLEVRTLSETENIKYSFEEVPVIEAREGMIGKYALDETGNVIVIYEPIPKTQLDLIQEQLNQLLGTTNTVVDDNLLSMEMAVTTDMKVDEINAKVDMITPQ